MLRSVNVALYGSNGHQIQDALLSYPHARLVATASIPRDELPAAWRADDEVRSYSSLDDILTDPRVDVVSLCSPRRRDQASDAIRSLHAGKHVYAEKPSALEEKDLDAILRAAHETGRVFREMAGTAFEQPYHEMRQIVREGRIGTVVQVVAEKSYPYSDRRPSDEDIDGGLIRQCAIHAVRFVEHVAGLPVLTARATETSAGNHRQDKGLRMAACIMFELKGGALGSIAANYLNPEGTRVWGYETLRILGDRGMVESTRGGEQTRLVIGGDDRGPIDVSAPGINYLHAYLDALRGVGSMPLTLEEELRATRWAIRAKRSASNGGRITRCECVDSARQAGPDGVLRPGGAIAQ